LAQVINKTGSLNNLLNILNRDCNYSFDSLQSIRKFTRNINSDIEEYKRKQRTEIQNEVNELNEKLNQYSIDYNIGIKKRSEKLHNEMQNNDNKILHYSIPNRNPLKNFLNFFRKRKLRKRQHYLDDNFLLEVEEPYQHLIYKRQKVLKAVNYLKENLDDEVDRRSYNYEQNLWKVQSVIDDNKPLLIGAIGEETAIEELQKLPDSFIIINDFKMTFNPSMYYRKENEHIKSVQIDHVVVGSSGVFLIETKYWSQQSIESFDLFSPVKQLLRSSYALFVHLNNAIKSGEINLKKHHWGDKEIKVRNILLMIGRKPNEEFQFIKIKSLKDVRDYIKWFDPIFSDDEFINIANFIINDQSLYIHHTVL